MSNDNEDRLNKEAAMKVVSEAKEIFKDIDLMLTASHTDKSVASWSLAAAMLDIFSMTMLANNVGEATANEFYLNFSITAPIALKEFFNEDSKINVPTDKDTIH